MMRFAALAALVAFGVLAGDPQVVRSSLSPCEADPWLVDLQQRVVRFDGLAHYAAERFGDPVACRGEVGGVFEGVKFGTVELRFGEGATLRVETLPPETSRVTLTAPRGFADLGDARRQLAEYVAQIGVQIDWTRPETTVDGADEVQRYWADDPGLNASAELVFTDGVLKALRFGMAL